MNTRGVLDGCGKSLPHRNSIPGPLSPSDSLYRLGYPATFSTISNSHKKCDLTVLEQRPQLQALVMNLE